MSAIETISKGETSVAYETKALLIAIAKIIRYVDDPKEIYKAVADIANAEGVVIEPYEETIDD